MSNNKIEFIDTSKEVKNTMVKLSKSALRASAKVAGKAIKAETQKRTGRLSKQVGYWAKINRDTGQPELQIGYYSKAQAKRKVNKYHTLTLLGLSSVLNHILLVLKS